MRGIVSRAPKPARSLIALWFLGLAVLGAGTIGGDPMAPPNSGPVQTEQQEAQEIISKQLSDLGCTPNTKLLTPFKAVSWVDVDTNVVYIMNFDLAWALATSGKIWVRGSCAHNAEWDRL